VTDQLSHDDLRALVREVLREALPQARPQGAAASEAVAIETDAIESVAIESDADLEAFVRRVLLLSDDPAQRADLLEGRIRFSLASRALAQEPSTPSSDVIRVAHGAVTERLIKEAARSGSTIVVGRAAVLTPLAHDRARALGVTIEKEHR
jgi:hypothetical protein